MLTPLPPRRVRAAGRGFVPEYVAFCIVERENEAPVWVRCGTARVNRDGSLNVRLDALPLTGELHLRPAPAPPSGDSRGAPPGAPVHG